MTKYIIYLFIVLCFLILEINAQGTYRAAVLEYATKDEVPLSLTRILKNVENYVYYMETAADKNVQIIVFPEYGLTGWENINYNTIDELSTEVPDPVLEISPCRTPGGYSKHLIDLSCAADVNKIYTVVNLIEKQHDNNSKQKLYHNTNVVFNDKGAVIARHRKINLYNEGVFTPGDQLVTFKTNFGVTFGMFICADLIFKKPAIDILANSTITDIVFSTAWFSQLPFYGALSIQHGYAKSNRVNLIAAGINDPSKKNGGSGIYLHDGRIAQTYIAGIRGTKILIQDVPKVASVIPLDTCQDGNVALERGIAIPGLPGGQLPDISTFVTSQEDLINYTFKSLNLDRNEISETICSGRSNFCCSFEITVARNGSAPLNYVYKLLAYYGVSVISTNTTVGLRNCALVACLNDTNASCGGRHKEGPHGIIFESISVKGNFNPNTTHAQPATITHKLVPITDYTFCEKKVNGTIEIEMKTSSKQNALLTFGIYGRVFTNDGKPVGPINSASSFKKNIYLTIIVSVLIFLLQD
ncbi:hypothetical protein ILUMI_27543 [Ignelater luminosus]|uniref:CN hydrolase domain-containing protein n=1 Tax=Ignelater luminosus TaxID=2038154 RepID=A0A8K0C4Y1_IGNLU|nr:hypothetical protein ILUMI_27543 [Ignelater luminosus]